MGSRGDRFLHKLLYCIISMYSKNKRKGHLSLKLIC